MQATPPKFITRLFKWFCQGDFYEELQGDLEEKFHEHVSLYGHRKARYIYQKEVLKMLRPSVVRTPRLMSSITQLSLFRIHLKLALRNVYKNRLFSAINIFGLGAALATSLFVTNIFYSAYTSDRQHPDAQALYRVVTHEEGANTRSNNFATTHHVLTDRILSDMPEAEVVTQVSTIDMVLLSSLEDINVKTMLVDEHFFQLFHFKAIDGNLEAIFDDPRSLIITEDIASQYFPEDNAIGHITPQGFVIQAIIKSPKGQSHIQFDAISNGAIHQTNPYASASLKEQWAGFPLAHTYLKLSATTSPESLQTKLDALSTEVNELIVSEQKSYRFKAQPILSIMLDDNYTLELGAPLGANGLKGFSIPIIILLLLACFNYTNLSIARALQRTREIGIRKTVGSSRLQISGQFLTEGVVFSLLALVIGYTIYRYFIPGFLSIDPYLSMIFSKTLDWQIIAIFIAFSVIVGLIAGLFPALHFSRISPLSAFNSRVKSNPLSIVNLRKVLVVLQIALSMFCILLVSLHASQNSYLMTADLGFDKENILMLKADSLQGTRYRTALEKIPEVVQTSVLSSIPGNNTGSVLFLINPVNNDSTYANFVYADRGFERLFQPELVSGSFFDTPGTNPLHMEALVNPKLLSHFNIDPDSAIGHVLQIKSKTINSIEITGVLKDKVFDNPIHPFDQPQIILNQKAHSMQKYLAVKIQSSDIAATISQLETTWEATNPYTELDIKFLSDHLENSYREMLSILNLITFLTIVVIGISVLGQLGMALYNAQTRIKEISIRKVLGAQFKTIATLLLKGTLISLTIATLIATPFAYLSFEEMMLDNTHFTFRPGLFEYARAILALSGLVIFVVVSQTSRVARHNPAETLKND